MGGLLFPGMGMGGMGGGLGGPAGGMGVQHEGREGMVSRETRNAASAQEAARRSSLWRHRLSPYGSWVLRDQECGVITLHAGAGATLFSPSCLRARLPCLNG